MFGPHWEKLIHDNMLHTFSKLSYQMVRSQLRWNMIKDIIWTCTLQQLRLKAISNLSRCNESMKNFEHNSNPWHDSPSKWPRDFKMSTTEEFKFGLLASNLNLKKQTKNCNNRCDFSNSKKTVSKAQYHVPWSCFQLNIMFHGYHNFETKTNCT